MLDLSDICTICHVLLKASKTNDKITKHTLSSVPFDIEIALVPKITVKQNSLIIKKGYWITNIIMNP